jgi:hypothetical protein
MYELSRVRLHAVGPKGARYQDVTLNLRDVGRPVAAPAPAPLWPADTGDIRERTRRPSPATVLFLENGGGKSVLIKLIFSVMLPGRRQVVGTTSTRVLDKFVLARDVAHIVLEWQDTKTGQLLVTGKASEWQGHVVSADPSRLTERWYSIRPTALFGLDTLPFTQDGRIVSLSGFRDRLEEEQRADPELQFVWEKNHGDWTGHLERLRLDPELYVYQRKMNAGEGEAADAFTFKTDEAFVDWLLTAIIPDAETDSLGDVVAGHAAKLAKRGELMAERDFVEGALGCLGPLTHAARERAAAIDLHDEARADAERLVVVLAAREAQEGERSRLLTDQIDDAGRRERSVEQDVRRLNAIVLELGRLVAQLRLEEGIRERERLEGERDATRKLLKAWAATSTLVRYEAARQEAEQIREIVRRQEIEAEPVLAARDTAAKRFARGLLAAASAADTAAKDAEAIANGLDEDLAQAGDDEASAIHDTETANAQISQATDNISAAQAAVREAVSAGLLADGADVAEAAKDAGEAAGYAETRTTDAMTRSTDLATEREEADREVERLSTELRAKSDVAGKLNQQLTAAQQISDGLCRTSRLADLLGSEEIVLDSDSETLLGMLAEAIDVAEQEQIRLSAATAEDKRVLDALGTGGLLPPGEDVEAALQILASKKITAWSGWQYLSSIRPDERDQVLARYPYLVDGIVLNSGDDLDPVRGELTAANLLPRTVIAVGTTAAILAADAQDPAGLAFIVPPNPAMYDEERAEEERQRIEERRETRNVELASLAMAVGADRELRSRLTAWRRDYPPGTFAKLAADCAQAATDLRLAEELVRKQRETRGGLVKAEKELHRQLPQLVELAKNARRKADDLAALAEQHSKIRGWSETIRTARTEKVRAEEEARSTRARAKELTRRQREAYREADGHRRTSAGRRDELGEVPGGGSVDVTMPAPAEPLESLRAAFKTAAANYEKVEVGADLRTEVGRLDKEESAARADVERLDGEVRERASQLLHTPDGADIGARDAATARTRRLSEDLEEQVTTAAGEVGRLRQAFDSFQKQERSLEPYGAPRDIAHGAELIAAATGEWDKARKELEAVQSRIQALRDQLLTTRQLAEGMGALRESLSALVTPGTDGTAEPFPGTVDIARIRRDEVRASLMEAIRLLEEATKQVRGAADALAKHAGDERFEKVTAPVKRQIMAVDREQLPEFAEEWESALRPRFRVLHDELQQIERHRAAIITRMRGMVTYALGRLRAAQRASRLPAGLGDWSGLEFLRMGFIQPEEAVLTERLGQVVDEATAGTADQGQASGKRDGLTLILNGVRESLRPKGVRVDMLKPDAVLRDERVRVAEIGDVFSGGQLLTAAIILYCTMACLRASERGHAQRPQAGVLFLDNPIGRASAGYLLELQMAVADKLGVQLMYTTGLFDTNALSVFPLIIRLRNDADLRAGMKYLRVDDEIRAKLPGEPSDDTGVLSASRLFSRPDDRTHD